tara:strand:- start:17 stop:631 length:615 start_codon:yes stop_codon:yes gene_type:complete
MSIIKLNNNGVKNATSFGSLASGSMVFIKKLTASGSSTLSFVDGSSGVTLDNSYKEYLFTFNNLHPSADDVIFSFQGSTDSGSNYNIAATTTFIRAYQREDGHSPDLVYETGHDEAQTTGFIDISGSNGSDNDQSGSGYLHLFNPSSDTFVKLFMSRKAGSSSGDYTLDAHMAGYFNTASAIDAIQFKMASGSFNGDICLYGIN